MAWWVSIQWWGDDRQVSQSGKPLCTGASLWAVPKLARGLRPLEPRHVNDVSNPAKCPPDIYRNTYGLTRVLPCTHQRGVAPYGIPVHFSRNNVAADKE